LAILGKLKEIKELTGIRHEAKVRKGKNSDGFVKSSDTRRANPEERGVLDSTPQ